MYMMLRVHILSKKVTYIKLKVIGCSPHPIHEYFKVNSLLLTLDLILSLVRTLVCIHNEPRLMGYDVPYSREH